MRELERRDERIPSRRPSPRPSGDPLGATVSTPTRAASGPVRLPPRDPGAARAGSGYRGRLSPLAGSAARWLRRRRRVLRHLRLPHHSHLLRSTGSQADSPLLLLGRPRSPPPSLGNRRPAGVRRAGLALLPQSEWRAILRKIIASALYVENWSLAASSVNYMGQISSPSSPSTSGRCPPKSSSTSSGPPAARRDLRWHERSTRQQTIAHRNRPAPRRQTIRLFGLVAIGRSSSAPCSLRLVADRGANPVSPTSPRPARAGNSPPAACSHSSPPRRLRKRDAPPRASCASNGRLVGVAASSLRLRLPHHGEDAVPRHRGPWPVLGTCLFLWAGNVPGPLSPAADIPHTAPHLSR